MLGGLKVLAIAISHDYFSLRAGKAWARRSNVSCIFDTNFYTVKFRSSNKCLQATQQSN